MKMSSYFKICCPVRYAALDNIGIYRILCFKNKGRIFPSFFSRNSLQSESKLYTHQESAIWWTSRKTWNIYLFFLR